LRDVKQLSIARKKIILGVGRLYYVKGFDRLIQAFALIANQCPDWNVHIIGSGPEAESLNLLIENNNLKNRILILPETKDIDFHLNTSEIFVMTSRSEGFPNALCEAMAAGLACLSFDFVAGPSEIITNDVNGFLIPDGDVNALAEMMLQLTENDEIRSLIGTNAQQIKEKLSYENTAKLYEEFIFA
jgi:glycosyltransferase involved in cell wall biosynthesis